MTGGPLEDEAFAFLFAKIVASHRDPAPSKRKVRGRVARVARGFDLFGALFVWAELARHAVAAPKLETRGRLAVLDHSSGMARRFLDAHVARAPWALRRWRAPFPSFVEARALAKTIRRRSAGRPADERAVAAYVTVKTARWRKVYDRLFAEGGVDALVVNDDMEPRRVAATLSALQAGRRLGYFVMAPGRRRVPPFPIDTLFCFEAGQASDPYAARLRCLWREGSASAAAPRPRRERYRVGLVMNAHTDDHLIRDAEQALLRHPRCASVHVRVHPNYRSAAYAAPTVPLERFLEDVDVVVIGNSGSGVEIALAGIPQLYSERLDYAGRDANALVARGFVRDDPRPLDAVDFDAAVEFRADPAFVERLAPFLQAPAGTVSVADGLKALSAA
ncbi:hypothetical protein GCM10008171_22970 [Methylopila jiangsuensis]|uniref:Capsule polysaccharide biosynthesis protein n=1 Tax=Methylopila jiangsuensis TaxID=586230 RepID=A0A9W6JIV8_9HYPH|nr:hypothetical protein [Methylopila jiangsuensis]MDR6286615.1 hypothetical protein [Methylopila jiangsuensis]GLK77043.1 hypothetical protein GCM10008171_22970 [Methylopila jiangsuensis]